MLQHPLPVVTLVFGATERISLHPDWLFEIANSDRGFDFGLSLGEERLGILLFVTAISCFC